MRLSLLPCLLALSLLPSCSATDEMKGSSDKADDLSDYVRVLVRTPTTRTICLADEVAPECDEILESNSVTVTATAMDDGRKGLTIHTEALVFHRPLGSSVRVSADGANHLGSLDISSAAIDVSLITDGEPLELRKHFPFNAFLSDVQFDAVSSIISRTASGPEACRGLHTKKICDEDNDILDLTPDSFATDGYSIEIKPVPYFNLATFDEGEYTITIEIEPLAE